MPEAAITQAKTKVAEVEVDINLWSALFPVRVRPHLLRDVRRVRH